jgi:fatty acid desaturase
LKFQQEIFKKSSISFHFRILGALFYNQKLFIDDLFPFALPAAMFLLGNPNILIVLKMWLFVIFSASFFFGFVGNNAGHHHNNIFHDGDALKSMDFGIYQLAATIDRNDVKDSLFLTLTSFGHHILHHFFPTLDHAILPQLQETFIRTCQEFEGDFRELPWWDLIEGQFKQLTRIAPNCDENRNIVK